MSKCLDTSSTTQKGQNHGKNEDPVVLLGRNLYGHPLAGLLWERQFEEALSELGWEKVPNWECMFVHRQQVSYLSVYVYDIKMAGKKQNVTLLWKKLMKNVYIDEPTSFLDHVFLGCTQREANRMKQALNNIRRCFESRISAGATEKLPRWAKPHANWQTRKWSNCTKFQALAWMNINSSRKNSNQLENCQKFAHKLS